MGQFLFEFITRQLRKAHRLTFLLTGSTRFSHGDTVGLPLRFFASSTLAVHLCCTFTFVVMSSFSDTEFT